MNHKVVIQSLKKMLAGMQPVLSHVRLPQYTANPLSAIPAHYQKSADLELWNTFFPILAGPDMIGTLATDPACLRQVIPILQKLEPDSYVRFLLAYYQAGLSRFGDRWRYADITTVLLAASVLMHPQHYLEVGVRRGRSLAMVAATCPEVEIVGFDMWVENYGGMENSGPDFVRSELKKVGFKGKLELVSGNSHDTIPGYFRQHPDAYFDLITVDGDHSYRGASMDLRDVLPRLNIGGVVVFDDIASPQAVYLRDVWKRYVANQSRFANWEFNELGFGIALGIRKY